MSELRTQLVSTLSQHAKYLAVGIAAFALAGGTATTVVLSSSGTPAPEPKGSQSTAPGSEADDKAKEKAAEKAAEAKEEAEGGVRPTDTHGYCVSQAVKKAKAAGKTGRDIAAAAHSCPKPNQAEKNAKAAAKAKEKAANPGKSSTAPGRAPQ